MIAQPWPPGTYITDGIRLLWVVSHGDKLTLVVENAWSGEETEVSRSALAKYRVVAGDGQPPSSGSRRKKDRKGHGAGRPRADSDIS